VGRSETLSGSGNPASRERGSRGLPVDLLGSLQQHEHALVLHRLHDGPAFALKAPTTDLSKLCEDGLIVMHHELHYPSTAPVIRTVTDLYADAVPLLSFELFHDVSDRDQRQLIDDLARETSLRVMLYDEQAQYREMLVIDNSIGQDLRDIRERAVERAHSIPFHRYDFERAVRDVIESTRLGTEDMVLEMV